MTERDPMLCGCKSSPFPPFLFVMFRFPIPLSRCPLPPSHLSLLHRHGLVSAQSVLLLSSLELSERLDLSYFECDAIRTQLACTMTIKPKTVGEIRRRRNKRREIEEEQEGGRKIKKLTLAERFKELEVQTGLTEIVGPAGMGKTQVQQRTQTDFAFRSDGTWTRKRNWSRGRGRRRTTTTTTRRRIRKIVRMD